MIAEWRRLSYSASNAFSPTPLHRSRSFATTTGVSNDFHSVLLSTESVEHKSEGSLQCSSPRRLLENGEEFTC